MSKHYRRATFLLSTPGIRQAPPDEGAEVAFAGRSNAGKSSAINTITGINALCRTSKTPGRTQHLVFFTLDESHRLVDLPGYGYAKVTEQMRREWQRHLAEYLERRESLKGLVLVMDIRHPLKEYDRQMLEWCRHVQLPTHILLTKSDKLKRGAAMNTLQAVKGELKTLGIHASVQIFSSLKHVGLEEAHAILDTWLGYSGTESE